MAEIDLFHYRKGSGVLHFIDARVKLLIFFLLTIITFHSNFISLAIITTAALLIFILEYRQSALISPFRFIKDIKFFLFFLLFIILTRWLAIGGIDGLQSGGVYSWKLFIILMNSQLLISTTNPSDIHGAVYKILKPLPFIPAGQIATMVSLTIAFIPLLFDQYLEIQDASYSRLGNNGKNPLKKISSIAFPLLQGTIFRAEEIAQAMESRCYNENPTMPDMKIKKADLFSLVLMLMFSGVVIFLNIYY